MTESNTSKECFSFFSALAQRALQNNSIFRLKELADFSEKEILKFHGLGKSCIPKLREVLKVEGLTLKT